ncbi:MYND finger domain-containing protein [Ditylenchus destructor]|uniref:MYND finger domain-containing protein n=1 Tax=Ditylenchus destructor TaxID=166010 RepID=A0AAD4R5M1_9BILA|nr:MYND finger domain-containing protein [Ditylenchus destructor]
MNVFLGFARNVPQNESYSLQRQYLPLGKIGGLPAWLNPVTLPTLDELTCPTCKKQMAFLMQIYCTDQTDPTFAFHRTIYLFLCRNPECSKPNDASNFVAFRCQLPRANGFYSSESALDPTVVGEVADPFYNESTYAKLCAVCGCSAGKKCARCTKRWYCCRDHQVIDWNREHKSTCGNNEAGDITTSTLTNDFLFPEFAVDIEDDEENEGEKLLRCIAQLKKFENVENGITPNDLEGLEEFAKDEAFNNFHNVISRNPEQILRYEKNGNPLLASDHAPEPNDIPPCHICGSSRRFEFQLTPHLVSLLGVDSPGQSIDWATVMVFTCSQTCRMNDDGYGKEFVFKQDFTNSVE